MKKLLVVLAVCLLVFGVAGQAKAYFTDGDLIRVMYDSSTNVEIATDLGAISSLTTASNLTSSTVSLSQFGSTATWSQVNVAYFADNASVSTAYVAAAGTPVVTWTKYNGGFKASANDIEGLYQSLGGSTVTTTTGNANSYYTLMDGNGSYAGQFSEFLKSTSPNGEMNMASLGTGLQELYAITSATSITGILSLTTSLDPTGTVASTTVNATAAPIPPSILLLGSGLLGLVGVGRKKLFV